MRISYTIAAFVAVSALSGNADKALANTITATALRSDGFEESMTVDPITGKFYVRNGYWGNKTINVYNNAADFASGHVGSTITLGADIAGMYIGAKNGQIIGRYDDGNWIQGVFPSGTTIDSFSATTGAVTGSNVMTNMAGVNITNTFNEARFTGPNIIQSGSDAYVLGNNNNQWFLNTLNDTLGVTRSQTVTTGRLGFAFDINGKLFLGPSFNDGWINSVFDIATGTLSSVNDIIAGLSITGIEDIFYSSTNDTLYLNSSDTIYSISNASMAFDAPSQKSSVPEPASVALISAGLIGFVVLRNRRKTDA